MRGGSAFVLVVEVRGFEPLAYSVRVRTSPPLCRPVFMQLDPTVRGEVRRTEEGVGDGAVDADLYLELRVGGHRVSGCKAGQRDGRTPSGVPGHRGGGVLRRRTSALRKRPPAPCTAGGTGCARTSAPGPR